MTNSNLGSGLKGLIGDTLGATIGISIRDFMAGLWNKGREHVEKRIEDLIKDNPRADLLYVLLALDPNDAAKLWQRHAAAVAAGKENSFTRILGQALPRNKEGQVDEERAKKVFSELAKMDEPQFYQVMEELNHDPIAQAIRHVIIIHGKDMAEAILLGIAQATGTTIRFANDKAGPWIKNDLWPALSETDPIRLRQHSPRTADLLDRLNSPVAANASEHFNQQNRPSLLTRLGRRLHR